MAQDISYLAARIVTEDVPEDRLKLLVELVRDVDDSDSHTMESLEQRVDDIAARFPGVRVVILGLGTQREWFVIDVHKGQTRWVKVADSAHPEEWVAPPKLQNQPRFPVKLSAETLDELENDGIDVERYFSEGQVDLYRFHEAPELLEKLIEAIADALPSNAPDRHLRVRTTDSPRWVMLAPGHYEIHPLYPYPVTVDARLKEAVRSLLKGPGDIGISDDQLRRRLEGEPEPVGPEPEELRAMIKQARKSGHTRRKSDVPRLLEMLTVRAGDEELIGELRKHVYRGITWHDTPEVREVLATAIVDEPDDVYQTLEHVMWRQRDFLADWLPEQLEDAEGDYRDRLLALREKHLGSR